MRTPLVFFVGATACALLVSLGCRSGTPDDAGSASPSPDGGAADASASDASATGHADGATTDGATTDGATTDGCTASAAIQAARAAIATGGQRVFVDCARTLAYSRTLAADGSVATETIDDVARGKRAVWDFTAATRTYREYRSTTATVAAHALDVTLLAADPDAGTAAATFIATDDTTGDDVPDRRVTWTVDPSSDTVPITVESDPAQNGSWSVDFTDARPMEQDKLSVVGTGTYACDDTQRAALEQGYRDAIDVGTTCLKGIDSDLGMQFYELFVNDSNVTVSCNPNVAGPCARANLTGAITHWFPSISGPNELGVSVFPNAFSPTACGQLGSTLFHEMSHFLFGPHLVGDGSEDPADRVYACERTCFGGGGEQTSQSCAACIGAKNDDPRCKAYPHAPCTDAPLPAWCPCGDGSWVSEGYLTCQVTCPNNLGCANVACVPTGRGPCQ